MTVLCMYLRPKSIHTEKKKYPTVDEPIDPHARPSKFFFSVEVSNKIGRKCYQQMMMMMMMIFYRQWDL